MSKNNHYVLESNEENRRLDRQSRMKAFDFKEELKYLEVKPGQKILDAGCGSGIVTEYLSTLAPGAKAVGWDLSKDRVQAANAKYGATDKIGFEQNNLLELNEREPSRAVDEGRFDAVVCRFVLRHFSPADGKKVIQNLMNVLKPGGTLYCVDIEILPDVFPASRFLTSSLRRIREAKSVDFQITRKMPALLMDAGFQSVDWHVLASEFKGEELSEEIENLKQSMSNAGAFVKTTLGGADRVKRFIKEYFAVLSRPGTVLFYNKVIASGRKPKPVPHLIRG